MWITRPNPHMWDEVPCLTLDVGLIRLDRPFINCGKNQRRFPTGYPQAMGIMRTFYILDDSKTTPHIWGMVFILRIVF